MTAIIKKELYSYFTSFLGYIFLAFFVFISALFSAFINILYVDPNYSYVLSSTLFLLLILVPVLTMRTFSEEARQKTDQLLFTAPLSLTEIVLGKYIGTIIIFIMALGLTIIFPLVLSLFGELPWAHIFTAYLGYFLLGASFIAIGIFVSVLTNNQMSSAIITFSILLAIDILQPILYLMPTSRSSSVAFVIVIIGILSYIFYNNTKNIKISIGIFGIGIVLTTALYLFNSMLFDGLIPKFFGCFSLMTKSQTFYLGILNIADITYYITFIAFFIYLTISTLEKRKWK